MGIELSSVSKRMAPGRNEKLLKSKNANCMYWPVTVAQVLSKKNSAGIVYRGHNVFRMATFTVVLGNYLQ